MVPDAVICSSADLGMGGGIILGYYLLGPVIILGHITGPNVIPRVLMTEGGRAIVRVTERFEEATLPVLKTERWSTCQGIQEASRNGKKIQRKDSFLQAAEGT